jgi:hypothetical protein
VAPASDAKQIEAEGAAKKGGDAVTILSDGEGNSTVEMTSLLRRGMHSTLGRKSRVDPQMRLKKRLLDIVDGKTVTIIMSVVVIFSLIGDDIRLWLTPKEADPYFFSGITLSFLLFGTEILVRTVVDDDFKYSFFFWLDIIATLSLILDVPWLVDPISKYVFDAPPANVDVHIGVPTPDSGSQETIRKVVTSLRLIRLIRILKIYKYIVGAPNKASEDQSGKKKKRKRPEVRQEGEDEQKEQTIFERETDPAKLGKSMLDTLTRSTITGILLMLITLPNIQVSQTDYSGIHCLRRTFWFGRSSCTDPDSFFCRDGQSWASSGGWMEVLRGVVTCAIDADATINKKLLWLYVPDFEKGGRMDSIQTIMDLGDPDVAMWEESEGCSGFTIGDDCPWRVSEMELVKYTPNECLTNPQFHCQTLQAYARFQTQMQSQQEARMNLFLTAFTCVVLTIANLQYSHDIETIVVEPIKKIIDIIQRLSEAPLKKPETRPPDPNSSKAQLKTRMLE